MATILVVDDEPAIVDLLTEVLEAEGHAVVPAYQGSDALALAIERTPDLVITDVMMPVLDGIALARQIRAHTVIASTPIILISAGLPPNLGDAGASIFIAKPFDLLRFVETLARLLDMAAPPVV